ncbi:MAG TPA: sugar phosphate isomerase/epimerase family protein [Spirochaetia bacterium]|nr:sugar phosphate isomerase/epimerase family protein [Spirochaetia bacterium]
MEFARRAHELGAAGIEIWAEQLWGQGDDPARLKAECDGVGVKRTIHGPSWDLNLCSIDAKMLKASLECTLDAVELASQLGASILVVHPGRSSLSGYFAEYHWSALKRSYVEICGLAAQRGVMVAVEAMEHVPKEFLCTPEEVNLFVDAVKSEGVGNIGVVADIAHLTTISPEPLESLAALKGVIELHVSNSTDRKLHTPLDEGALDFQRILPALEAHYEVPIVIEGISVGSGYDLASRNARAYLNALG